MQYWVPCPDNLTTIYTLAHLALATHMKAGWVSDPQVALTTLKLRANVSVTTLWGHSHTEFKSLQLPSS